MTFRRTEFNWRTQTLDDYAPASTRSVTTSPFLTPPYTICGDPRPPFKAPASDASSLTLKRRHHTHHSNHSRHKANRSGNSHESVLNHNTITGNPSLHGARSLPCLKGRAFSLRKGRLFNGPPTSSKPSWKEWSRRRWTLPSKAASTRSLSTNAPICKNFEIVCTKRPRPSPAVVTLRRATNSLSKDTQLTFFPPPVFNRTRASFLANFLDTITREPQESPSVISFNERLADTFQHHSARRASQYEIAHTFNDDAVAPTITQVNVAPVVSDMSFSSFPFHERRCSTRYMTRASTYEVIWDENDTPTSSSELSRRPTADLQMRRQSVAVAKLETQLQKAVTRSRRNSTSQMRQPLYGIEFGDATRWNFQEMLNRSFSRLLNESALRNLPRSKASQTSQFSTSADGKSKSTAHEVYQHPYRRDLEVFPPFQSFSVMPSCVVSRSSVVNQEDRLQCNQRDFQTNVGKPIGLANYEQNVKHPRREKGRKCDNKPTMKSMVSESISDEAVPLLNDFAWQTRGSC